MHFHYFSLYPLAAALLRAHKGECIAAVFSQNRNELVLELETGFVRVGCHAPLTYILPEIVFGRARKNTVELFPEVLNLRLTDSYVLAYERVLVLVLENGYSLVLKMHAIQSNVLLMHEGAVTAIFNSNLEKDFAFTLHDGSWDDAVVAAMRANPPEDEFDLLSVLKQVSPVLEKRFAARIWSLALTGMGVAAAFDRVMDETTDNTYWVAKEGATVKFWLFDPGPAEGKLAVEGIVPAIRAYLRAHFQLEGYRTQYALANVDLYQPAEKTRRALASALRSIGQIEDERSPEEIGHLLMANLHLVAPDAKSIVCEDFYREGASIEIKLDPDKSPQENATRYYTKHKDRRTRLQFLYVQAEDLEQRFAADRAMIAQFEELLPPDALPLGPEGFDTTYLREVKKFVRIAVAEEAETKSPYHTFTYDGWQIFVGRNAKNNDQLTLHFAHREDLWLHAKDASGSHVIVRAQGKKPFPRDVIEFAASLAAFNSRLRTSDLVPVQFTPRKYVRKRKGDPAGAVVVEREDVVLVAPWEG